MPSTNSVYNTVASTTECRFVCETGYNRNGSACVANTQTASCPTLTVANATSNGATSWTQTRSNINGWTPPTYAWTHNTNPGICTFQCNSGFNRNGSACVQNTPVNTCESHYGEACTGTGDTLGLGGTCLGYIQGNNIGTCAIG